MKKTCKTSVHSCGALALYRTEPDAMLSKLLKYPAGEKDVPPFRQWVRQTQKPLRSASLWATDL